MSSLSPSRPHFQQLADLVAGHAAAAGWPAVTYQAAFISVVPHGGGQSTLEGNSIFWNDDWNSSSDHTNHPVGVGSGEQSWRTFLADALYPDLLRSDEELQKHG